MSAVRPLVLAALAAAVVGCGARRSEPTASAAPAPVPAPASAAVDTVERSARIETAFVQVTQGSGPVGAGAITGSATDAVLPPLPDHLDGSTTDAQLVLHAELTARSEAAAGLFPHDQHEIRRERIVAHWRPLLAERIAVRRRAEAEQDAWRALALREAVLRSQHRNAIATQDALWAERIGAVERSILPVDSAAVRAALAARPYRRTPGLGSCWNSFQP
jgi:hypothetical protein